MTKTLTILLIMFSALPTLANVIRVERDGSADFTVIQDAVDAAASGDTISVGVGRFDEGSIVTTAGWTEFVRVLISVEELTIIGNSQYSTFIGPLDPYDQTDGDHRGIEYSDYWGSKRLTLINLSFENMFLGVGGHMTDPNGSSLVVKGCRFSGCKVGISGSADQIMVEDSLVQYAAQVGQGFAFYGGGSLDLTNCTFRELVPLTGSYQLRIQGPRVASVIQTSFQWGGVGFYVGSGGQAILRDCSFSGQSHAGVNVAISGSSAELIDCTFSDQRKHAINVNSDGITLRAERIVINAAAEASFRFTRPVNGYIHNSLLAKGNEYVVIADTPVYDSDNPFYYHFDMTDNWWGTDNPDSIQAWIYDSVADTSRSTIVDWEPYKDESVAAERQNLGDFKAMYR